MSYSYVLYHWNAPQGSVITLLLIHVLELTLMFMLMCQWKQGLMPSEYVKVFFFFLTRQEYTAVELRLLISFTGAVVPWNELRYFGKGQIQEIVITQ